MPPAESLPVPRWQRVFAIVLQRIRNNEYPIGSALDSEDRLAREFGCSKATVRLALGELAQRGWVVRRQGKGTFVTDGAAREPGVTPLTGSFAELILENSSSPIREQTVRAGVPFPHSVRARLAMNGGEGVAIEVRRFIDDVPFTYALHYLSGAAAEHLGSRDFHLDDRFDLLRDKGMTVSHAEQSITAQLADITVAEKLGIDIGAPVLSADRTTHGDQGVIEVVHTWFRADLYRWEAKLAYYWTADGTLVMAIDDDRRTPLTSLRGGGTGTTRP